MANPFSKKEAVKAGPSFPFMERVGNTEFRAKYDAIRVDVKKDSVTIIFAQDDVDICAWTFERPNASSDVTVSLGRLNGSVSIGFRP